MQRFHIVAGMVATDAANPHIACMLFESLYLRRVTAFLNTKTCVLDNSTIQWVNVEAISLKYFSFDSVLILRCGPT